MELTRRKISNGERIVNPSLSLDHIWLNALDEREREREERRESIALIRGNENRSTWFFSWLLHSDAMMDRKMLSLAIASLTFGIDSWQGQATQTKVLLAVVIQSLVEVRQSSRQSDRYDDRRMEYRLTENSSWKLINNHRHHHYRCRCRRRYPILNHRIPTISFDKDSFLRGTILWRDLTCSIEKLRRRRRSKKHASA